MRWPAEGPISQRFGENPDLYSRYGLEGHEGVDVGVPVGTPLYAPHGGVAYRLSNATYGLHVLIQTQGLESWTAHLSEFAIEHEADIKEGELIGYSGNTGRSSGPHYHFSYRPIPRDYDNGYRGCVDPMPYMEDRDVKLWPQCQGHNYEDWVVEHARKCGGVKLINPQHGDYQRFVAAGVQILGRIVWPGDYDKEYIKEGAAGAERWFTEFWAIAQTMPEITLWEGPNEPAIWNEEDAQKLSAFTARLADLFHAHGLRLVGLNFSSGHPDFALWRYLGEALEKIDFLGRHAYKMAPPWLGWDEWHLMRLATDVANIRDAGHRVPPIILGETGIDRSGNPYEDGWRARGVSREEFTEMLVLLKTDFAQAVPELKAISPFVWLSTGWPSFDIDRETSAMLVNKWLGEEEEMDKTLANGDFEAFRYYDNVPELYVAEGWTPFWASPPYTREGDDRPHYDYRPEYKQAGFEENGPARAIGGSSQQFFNTYAAHRAGLYQQISVEPGSIVSFGAEMMSWHSQDDDPNTSMGSDYIKRVGIDPKGGTDPFSEDVVWGADSCENDKWVLCLVDAEASNDVVTLFIYGEAVWPYKHNDCYIDAAGVHIISSDEPLPEDEEASDAGTLVEKVRWWQEEAVRELEAMNVSPQSRAMKIMHSLVKLDDGLLYRAERAVKEQCNG